GQCERDCAWRLPHRHEHETARYAARPRVARANTAPPVRPSRRARRRGGLPGIRGIELRHGAAPGRRWRVPGERSEPVNAALVISDRDNVATALEALEPGRLVDLGGRQILIGERIPSGHKLALVDIAAGEPIVKYGSPIGKASVDIRQGTHVHTHNLESTRGRGDLAATSDPQV